MQHKEVCIFWKWPGSEPDFQPAMGWTQSWKLVPNHKTAQGWTPIADPVCMGCPFKKIWRTFMILLHMIPKRSLFHMEAPPRKISWFTTPFQSGPWAAALSTTVGSDFNFVVPCKVVSMTNNKYSNWGAPKECWWWMMVSRHGHVKRGLDVEIHQRS